MATKLVLPTLPIQKVFVELLQFGKERIEDNILIIFGKCSKIGQDAGCFC